MGSCWDGSSPSPTRMAMSFALLSIPAIPNPSKSLSRKGAPRMKVGTVIAAAGWLCLAPVFATAQSSAASKPTPRTPDGHPDLNGQWHHRIGEPAPLIKPGESYNAKAAHAPGINQYQEPAAVYKPEFQAKVKDLDEHSLDKDPSWSCGPPGVPRIGPPQKIVQTAKELVFLYDDLTGNFFRVVRMNVPHRKEI